MSKRTNVDRAEDVHAIVSRAVRELNINNESISSSIKKIQKIMETVNKELKDNVPSRGWTYPKNFDEISSSCEEVEEAMKDFSQGVTNEINYLTHALEEYEEFYERYMQSVEERGN